MWIEKEGQCQVCGKKIIRRSASHKYCSECSEAMHGAKTKMNREKMKAKRIASLRGTDPDRYKKKGQEYECKSKGSCIYGGAKFCEYMAVTGHSRLVAGYPIKDGKCGAYKRGKKKRIPITLPSGGEQNYADLAEV